MTRQFAWTKKKKKRLLLIITFFFENGVRLGKLVIGMVLMDILFFMCKHPALYICTLSGRNLKQQLLLTQHPASMSLRLRSSHRTVRIFRTVKSHLAGIIVASWFGLPL